MAVINTGGLLIDLIRPSLGWEIPQIAIQGNLNVLFFMLSASVLLAAGTALTVFILSPALVGGFSGGSGSHPGGGGVFVPPPCPHGSGTLPENRGVERRKMWLPVFLNFKKSINGEVFRGSLLKC
jgi:hypothetical protein